MDDIKNKKISRRVSEIFNGKKPFDLDATSFVAGPYKNKNVQTTDKIPIAANWNTGSDFKEWMNDLLRRTPEPSDVRKDFPNNVMIRDVPKRSLKQINGDLHKAKERLDALNKTHADDEAATAANRGSGSHDVLEDVSFSLRLSAFLRHAMLEDELKNGMQSIKDYARQGLPVKATVKKTARLTPKGRQ